MKIGYPLGMRENLRNEVYITGHRNPDMDSLCAAYAYAALKSSIDRIHEYKAVRCGHLSDSVKGQLEVLGIEAPPYMRDVHPKVGDVMRTGEHGLDCKAPIFDLIRIYDQTKPSAVAIFDWQQFKGLLSVDDITSWFLKDNSGGCPCYVFNSENFGKVIPGRYISQKGDSDSPVEFRAVIKADTNDIDNPMESIVVIPFPTDDDERGKLAKAIALNVPAIIITGVNGEENPAIDGYQGIVYASNEGIAETIRRLRMAPSVSTILGQQGPILQVDDFFDVAKEQLSSSKLRGLAVFDQDKYAGFVTRRCFLKKPKYSVILVDHNEPDQSIRGIETAEIKEIIDHHRLDAPKTDLPIFIDSEPLGSTCTIIYQLFLRNNVVPDKTTSKVLLAGILTDTIILRSPTTTGIDIWSAERLAPMSGVVDLEEFGRSLFTNVGSLATREPETVISSDFKTYKEGNINLGIGQCEVQTLQDVDEYSAAYLAALEKIKRLNHLDWVMLMITDVLKGQSLLLSSDFALESKFSYEKLADHVYDIQDTLSRKKQLLPEIIHIINM